MTRGELMYEVVRVLFDGVDPVYLSDESHLGDFDRVDDDVRQRAREAWGIEIPSDEESQYVWMIADLVANR